MGQFFDIYTKGGIGIEKLRMGLVSAGQETEVVAQLLEGFKVGAVRLYRVASCFACIIRIE